MIGWKPTALLFAASLCGLVLAGCSTTDTPEGHTRVETWTWGSDGSEEHSVTYKKNPEKGPEWELGGLWHIQDYTDSALGNRHCYVDLTPAKAGEYTFVSKYVPNTACDPSMKIVAGWRPTGSEIGDVIILVDGNGGKIGEFDRTFKGTYISGYKGVFTLTSGEVVKAFLKRY